jgi:hypothetical protein
MIVELEVVKPIAQECNTAIRQISEKLIKLSNCYGHWCDACKTIHLIITDGVLGHIFDGNIHWPTFDPTIRIYSGHGRDRVSCHYRITRGSVQYHDDSYHFLKGHIISLPDLPYDWKEYV